MDSRRSNKNRFSIERYQPTEESENVRQKQHRRSNKNRFSIEWYQPTEESENFRQKQHRGSCRYKSPSPASSIKSKLNDFSVEDSENLREEQYRWSDNHRAPSPASSIVSERSDKSKDEPLTFREEQHRVTGVCRSVSQLALDERGSYNHRAASPASSIVSERSDNSKDEPLTFREEPPRSNKYRLCIVKYQPTEESENFRRTRSKNESLTFREEQPRGFNKYRSPSPASSIDSELSDFSIEDSENLREEQYRGSNKHRPPSPVLIMVSERSDRPKNKPLYLRQKQHRGSYRYKSPSPASSIVSERSDKSKDEPLTFREEQHRVTGVCRSVSQLALDERGSYNHRAASPASSIVSERSDNSKDEPLTFREEPPRSNLYRFSIERARPREESENVRRTRRPNNYRLSIEKYRPTEESKNLRQKQHRGSYNYRSASPASSIDSDLSDSSTEEFEIFREEEYKGSHEAFRLSPLMVQKKDHLRGLCLQMVPPIHQRPFSRR